MFGMGPKGKKPANAPKPKDAPKSRAAEVIEAERIVVGGTSIEAKAFDDSTLTLEVTPGDDLAVISAKLGPLPLPLKFVLKQGMTLKLRLRKE